jgi:ribonuclease HI
MELQAMIAGLSMIPEGETMVLYTDSNLVVNTLTKWASGWEKAGWKRKDGEVKNLELVKEAYALARARPKVAIRWIKAHDGSRWNEYADALASAYMREQGEGTTENLAGA